MTLIRTSWTKPLTPFLRTSGTHAATPSHPRPCFGGTSLAANWPTSQYTEARALGFVIPSNCLAKRATRFCGSGSDDPGVRDRITDLRTMTVCATKVSLELLRSFIRVLSPAAATSGWFRMHEPIERTASSATSSSVNRT
jgi:hypothetical protein